MTRRRPLFLPDPRTPDEDVLVGHTGARGHEVLISHVPTESDAEVHPARVAETANRFACMRVERVEAPIDGEEDAVVATISPVNDTAVDMGLSRTVRKRIESPEQRAAVGP